MNSVRDLRIAIIDDERPARANLRFEVEALRPNASIVEADSGAGALQLLTTENVDLLFLDINLGDMNSTVLIPALHKLQPDMMICFVTAYSEYALEAFQLEVDDYVMKPFEPERIERVLVKCESKASSLPEEAEPVEVEVPQRFAISSKDRTIYEDIDNIIFIETYERGCNIYTATQVHFDTHSIGQIEKRLPGFFRIHKSYLVNPPKIREVFPWGKNTYCLKMDGYRDNILPIARDRFKALRELLEK